MLRRWARFTVRRRWWVLGVWLAVVVALAVISQSYQGEFVKSIEIPGSDSDEATSLLRERFPERAGDTAMIVLRSDAGLDDSRVQLQVQEMVARAQEIPGVVRAVPPYVPETNAISEDGEIGFILVQFEQQADAVSSESLDALYEIQEEYGTQGLQVELGGQVITASEQTPPSASEGLGVVLATFILLLAFGSFIAMGLPLGTAFVGLITSVFVIGLLALRLDFTTETRAFTAMIGIGIGIDYALFIVTRFREGLHNGLDVESAVVQALDTAGRAIMFAGAVVVVSLAGLATIGIPFLATLGLAAAIVVILAVLVALSVLPALLAIIGNRIDRWRIGRFYAVTSTSDRGTWYKIAELSQRRPWLVLFLGLAFVLTLSAPALDMRVGSADAGNNPTSLTSRHAYDLLAEGFGPGFNGPLAVVVDLSESEGVAVVDGLVQDIRQEPGVAMVAPPTFNAEQDTGVVNVIPTTAPQSEETQELVHRLRFGVLDNALQDTGAIAYVGGPTAAFIDIADQITDRLPYFFGIVIGISMLLLMVIFRSLLVPLVSAVMVLLSIGAAYGVLVAVFQWGWLSGLFGIDQTGPIESFLPMMLFAVLFGLSTDYMVFLMSRIHEIWRQTEDNRKSILLGSVTTTRVISAAAAIMVLVFLSFTLNDSRIVTEFGLGLATAVFVDATVIRMLLVPAVIGLLGKKTWYFPGWLDWYLPRVDVEAPEQPSQPVLPVAGEAHAR
jgi:putative drug exporter of the RND superfamily